jgi:hypothetical protein
MAVGGCK